MTPLGTSERFEILGRLGEGGLGVVYRARDAATGQEFALKVVASEAHGEDERLRFKQEFRAMARLRHPNLCEVHDFGLMPDGAPYFTMEIVPGEDMAAMIPLAPERLLALLPQLARALRHLHQQGLVHGDVKPENVRVAPDGTVKLMDLGFLMPAGQAAPVPRGTLAYVAPEVVRGDRVDQRADIYALGAMCHHLLSGRPPFAGETPLEVLRAHLTHRPRPLRALDATISPQLEQVIAKMMAREPVARPSSLGEVLAALGLDAEEEAGAAPLAGAFVGRAAELEDFNAALAALKAGKGGAQWIVGAAGTGKSRLLEELRVAAQLEEVPFLAGACAEQTGPYGAFVRILRGLLPALPAILETASAEQRAALGRIMPELAGGGEASGLEPQEERIVLQSAIAHVLRAVAARGGAVIALDDWNRADAASAETLAYLRRNAQGVPFLIVGTAREAGYLDASAKALPPLTPAEVGALVASMLGAPAPDDFATALFRWTGGHAGHVQRVVDHLWRTGALRREGGRWVFPDDLASCDLGADFRELMLAPLAALTGPATQIAELTAVVGPGADLKALIDLSGLEEETLFMALDELRARKILEVRDGRVAFTAGSLEDAVYTRMAEGRRLWHHAAAALRLEESLAADMPADVAARTALARHYLRSRQAPKALPAAALAADLNMAVFAVDTARALLRDGLQLMTEAPGQHDRWRRDYLGRLASVERWRGDFEALGACLDEAVPLAERLDEPEPLARLLVAQGAYQIQRMTPTALRRAIAVLERAASLPDVEDPAVPVRGSFYLGQAHFYLGQPAEARAAFEAAASRAEVAGLASWRAKAWAFGGYLAAMGGATAAREEGFRLLGEAAALQAQLGDRYGLAFTAAMRGDALLAAMRLPDAEAAFEAQIAVNEELGVGEDRVTGMANLAIVHALSGRYRAAIEGCERVVPLATQLGQPVALLAKAVGGFALAAAGDLRRAEEALGAAEAAGRGGGGYMFSHAVPFLLEGWLRLGRADEARRVAEEALFLFRDHPDAALQAQTAALLGEARLGLGEAEAARALAEEAAQATRGGDYPLARFQATRLLARLAQRDARYEAAREAADHALGLAERAGALGLAAEAAGLLGEIELSLGRPEAAGRFRAMQAFADAEGVPFMRALALAGQAAADAASERGEALALEAQQILRSLADGLAPLARQAFLSTPSSARVLAERPVLREPISIEGGQRVFERIMTLSQDLQGFAAQYGALFKEWVASNRQLEMLNALAHRINESLDLDDVLPQVAALTLELTKAERAFVLLRDEGEPDRLVVRAAVDHKGRAIPDARYSASVVRGVLVHGQPVAVLDASLSEAMRAQQSIADLDLRTLMCVPLSARGKTQGVLYVDSQAVVTTFTSKDLELLRAIASHAGVAIANATLYAESRRRAEALAQALGAFDATTRRGRRPKKRMKR